MNIILVDKKKNRVKPHQNFSCHDYTGSVAGPSDTVSRTILAQLLGLMTQFPELYWLSCWA